MLPRLSLPLPEPDPVEAALLHMDLVTTLEKLRTKLQVGQDVGGPQDRAGCKVDGKRAGVLSLRGSSCRWGGRSRWGTWVVRDVRAIRLKELMNELQADPEAR